MAGMGPPPKDPEKRLRRNKPAEKSQLPAKRTGKVPAWPLAESTPAAAALWTELWRKPVAVLWERQACEREVAQYVLWKLMAEAGVLAAAQEARQLSDRLLLNPMALHRAGLTVADDEVAEKRASSASSTPASKARRRLKAV